MSALTPEHPLLAGLCDDAAVFPPGNLPLAEAVPAHLDHALGAHAALVGPFVLAAKDLPSLADITAGLPEAGLELALTSPLPDLAGALEHAGTLPAVRVVALEIALPEDAAPGEVVPTLDTVLAGRERLSVAVEVPRDGRRAEVIAALAGTPYTAKLRTGGVRAELYPDEAELAAAVAALVAAGVPFKATAGLHHALRNTDPDTGFEQHGYLNLLAATGAALTGADADELARLLGERDGATVTERVRALEPGVRETFRSFGTCSITDPTTELVDLGLLTPDAKKDLP
ncbi:hypothetical protein [Janibacter corallicola]|uniref:hypothetical protein n=1 Tax=Janibacter corallicola TaxID=415212 RepID=UPI0008313420|nr:hypothetical protein [Janibacter corallicola]